MRSGGTQTHFFCVNRDTGEAGCIAAIVKYGRMRGMAIEP
jgi:hypothetical protein